MCGQRETPWPPSLIIHGGSAPYLGGKNVSQRDEEKSEEPKLAGFPLLCPSIWSFPFVCSHFLMHWWFPWIRVVLVAAVPTPRKHSTPLPFCQASARLSAGRGSPGPSSLARGICVFFFPPLVIVTSVTGRWAVGLPAEPPAMLYIIWHWKEGKRHVLDLLPKPLVSPGFCALSVGCKL